MKSLKIILPIGLCAIVITGIVTNKSRTEAKKQLQHEEMLSSVRSQAVLAGQEVRRKSDEERRQAEEDRQYKSAVGIKE
jgi:ABC-type bacteriocin/lantibiotic exporter with double-glycine peptidase domain